MISTDKTAILEQKIKRNLKISDKIKTRIVTGLLI